MTFKRGLLFYWSWQELLLFVDEDGDDVPCEEYNGRARRAMASFEGTWRGRGEHPNRWLPASISSVSVATASWMPSPVFADTSVKAMPNWSASCWPISTLTTLPWALRSFLVPMSINLQLSGDHRFASSNHLDTLLKEYMFVMSYRNSTPWAFLKHDDVMLPYLSGALKLIEIFSIAQSKCLS